MGKMKTLDYFYKRKVNDEAIHKESEEKRHKASTSEPQPQEKENQQENDIFEATPSNPNEVDFKNLERDPAKRKQMWDYPVNLREQVRRAYMNLGPFHIRLKEYQAKGSKKLLIPKIAGIIDDVSATYSQRGDADAAYCYMKSFEFVFILHLIKEVMGKTEILSQALQKKSQDILNAMELVSATKEGLNDFRNKGWESLLAQVKFFCEKHQVDMPDMNAPYTSTRYRPRKTDNHVTFEHFYRVDLFTATLDKQLHELNSRFNDQAMELLSLSSTLVSKVINIDQICFLVEKYYPEDFTEHERVQLRYQLEIFNIDMAKNPRLSGVSTIADLCKGLVETHKRETYYLLDRVIRLILTLPVSTATTERGFSAMKIFKNRLRNKMSDDFLANNLVVYIERKIDGIQMYCSAVNFITGNRTVRLINQITQLRP